MRIFTNLRPLASSTVPSDLLGYHVSSISGTKLVSNAAIDMHMSPLNEPTKKLEHRVPCNFGASAIQRI